MVLFPTSSSASKRPSAGGKDVPHVARSRRWSCWRRHHQDKSQPRLLLVVIVLPILLVSLIFLLAAVPMIYDITSEFFVHYIAKGWLVHDLLNSMARQSTELVRHRSNTHAGSTTSITRKEVVLWQHVPRTASDTMRTHLFQDLDYENSPPFPSEYQSFVSNMTQFREFVVGVHDADTDAVGDSTTGINKTIWYAKGFLSRVDVQALLVEGGTNAMDIPTGMDTVVNVRRVIFLRHPIERILSLVTMVRPVTSKKSTATSIEQEEELSVAELLQAYSKKQWHSLSAAELIQYYYSSPAAGDDSNSGIPFRDARQGYEFTQKEWVETHLHNSMTWQLGHAMDYGRRYPLESPSMREELLNRAKDTIRSCEFIGFYETLPSSFYRLWRHSDLYVPIRRSWILPPLFYMSALISLPRLVTLKYSARLTEEEWKVLAEWNDLDLELWDWAVKEYGGDMVLYHSYGSFFWGLVCWWTGPLLVLGFWWLQKLCQPWSLSCWLPLWIQHHAGARMDLGRDKTT